MIHALKFFAASRLHPKHSGILLAICVAFGTWTMWYDAGELDASLGLVLVVQLFLVSTGFTARAFSGHFDMLMVHGGSRRRAAAAHWLVSIAPGVLAWLTLTLVALLLGSDAAVSALGGQRAVALVVVSSIAWLAGYRLPRGAAGVLWLTLLVAILLQHNLRALSMSVGQHGWIWETAMVVVCPFLLIGDKPVVPPIPLIAAMAISSAALLVAFGATENLNVVLKERG